MTTATKRTRRTVATDEWRPTTPAYLLRTCASDGSSYGSFRWPLEVGAVVEAPDWSPQPMCGNGLHGLLNGRGKGDLLSWEPDAVWMVVAVESADVVDLKGKVKAPRAVVLYCGDREGAARYLVEDCGVDNDGIVGGTATAGHGGTATAGYGGTATAGDGGIATAGYRGTATAGDYGTATAGGYGTATAGDGGIATAGDGGTATAGDGGTIILQWWDGARRRVVIGYVGEDGIEANVPYRLDAQGKLEVAR